MALFSVSDEYTRKMPVFITDTTDTNETQCDASRIKQTNKHTEPKSKAL